TGSDRGRFIRHCIVQQNLYGLATSPAAATSVVRDLLGYCQIRDTGDAILDCNVARTEPASATPASRARAAGAGQVAKRPETADGVQAFCAVAAAVRRQRLSGRGRPQIGRASCRERV